MDDGAVVRVRRHGNLRAPRLVLSHGNGFAIDAYFPFWRLFFADCEVVVYDQRNYGRNPFHGAAGHTLQRMADDLQSLRRAIEARFGRRRTAGAFHSLSATVSLLHAAAYGFEWDALVLFDPPITPPQGHPLHQPAADFERLLSESARRRRSRFAAPEELAASLARSRTMRRAVDGAAELMARAITRRSAGGGCELACPPQLEASIYLQNMQAPAWEIASRLARELFVVSSDPQDPGADPPARVCAALQRELGVAVTPVPGTGHMLQIEQPAAVEAAVRPHLRSRGFYSPM